MTILQPINADLTFDKLFPQYVAITVNFSLSEKKKVLKPTLPWVVNLSG